MFPITCIIFKAMFNFFICHLTLTFTISMYIIRFFNFDYFSLKWLCQYNLIYYLWLINYALWFTDCVNTIYYIIFDYLVVPIPFHISSFALLWINNELCFKLISSHLVIVHTQECFCCLPSCDLQCTVQRFFVLVTRCCPVVRPGVWGSSWFPPVSSPLGVTVQPEYDVSLPGMAVQRLGRGCANASTGLLVMSSVAP